MDDPQRASLLRWACASDPLFWINSFVWTYNPKSQGRKKLPFVTWPFQDKAIRALLDSVGNHDVLIEKSRDMGASWICLMAILWQWLYHPLTNFLLSSRNDDYVDKSDEPKSLFWKLDFALKNLPVWLLPAGWHWQRHRKVKRLVNPENGAVIVGEATTEDLGRGGRFTAILLDEFAACQVGMGILRSTGDATDSRWFNSTPKGTGNAHYRMVQRAREKPEAIRTLRFHWPEHPQKGAGLYTSDKLGALEIRDKSYAFPPDYPFLLDGKLRSPWYDRRCARAATAAEVAQEEDIDYLGSGYGFFEADRIEALIQLACTPPRQVGFLDLDDDTLQPKAFHEHPKGPLALWLVLAADGIIPIDRPYVAGVDAAAGSGASNSVISIWDGRTGEKVAAYVNPRISPEALAREAVGLCRWFNDAFIVWEVGGSGTQFGTALMALGYGHYYCRDSEATEQPKRGNRPGWSPTPDNKLQLLGAYRQALHEGTVCNRDEAALRECLQYVYTPANTVEHQKTVDCEDPSGARKQHGDRVIADALGVKLLGERVYQPSELVFEASPLSYAGRQQLRRERAERRRQPQSEFVFN